MNTLTVAVAPPEAGSRTLTGVVELKTSLIDLYGEGGNAISYEREDPFIRKEYKEQLAREGVEFDLDETDSSAAGNSI